MGVDSLVVMLLIDALIATLVITALLTVLWLVLHVLVRRWRHQVQARSQVVQSRLEAIKGDARGFQQEADRYSVDDPEPYGSIARELHETLISIRQAYSKLIGQSNRLMTDDLLLAGNLVSRLLVGFWREPRQWRQRVGEWVVLDASVQELAPQTAHAASMVERLHQLPAQIHDQVLDLHQATAESLQIAQALDDRGVHGDTLTSITAHVHELQASLAALLTVLEGDTDRPTTETPTKEDIATAWRTLREIRRPLGTHLKKLGQYQSTHKDIALSLIHI